MPATGGGSGHTSDGAARRSMLRHQRPCRDGRRLLAARQPTSATAGGTARLMRPSDFLSDLGMRGPDDAGLQPKSGPLSPGAGAG